MTEKFAQLQVASTPAWESVLSYFFIIILLGLLIYGIILFIKSRNIPSKSLKAGLLIPFAINLVMLIGYLTMLAGFIYAENLVFLLAFYGILPLSILSFVSVILSAVSLTNSGNRFLSVGSIIYGLIFLIWFGFGFISILSFTM